MRKLVSVFILVLSVSFLRCKQGKRYHDEESKQESLVVDNRLQDILSFQKAKNEKFSNPKTSPLPDRYRKNFIALDFFAPDTNYAVYAKLVRTPNAVPFQMQTTSNRKFTEVVYGVAYFMLNGQEHQLEIYQNAELIQEKDLEDYLFLPFTDLTNDEETYGGGRYIDLRIPKGDSIIIDFNKAYNPFCAYNRKYSCPIVPKVNHLNIKVLAGEKAFKMGVDK